MISLLLRMPLEVFVQRLPPSMDFTMPFLKNATNFTSAFVGAKVACAACAGVDRRFHATEQEACVIRCGDAER
jgi:hypothetical protein